MFVCLQISFLNNMNDSLAFAAEAIAKDEAKDEGAVKKLKAEKKPAKQQQDVPLTIEGDDLFLNDATGEVQASGNVIVTKAADVLMTEELRGNTKANEVWIDGVATILQADTRTKLTGQRVSYNYSTKTGHMDEMAGLVGAERLKGKMIDLYPQKLVAHEASMTRCPAKVPDYHISASKVEIWPGNKLIAYDAKVWIRNTVIYSIAKYQRSLSENEKSELPRIDYSNGDGVSLQQYFEYPLSKNWAVATDQIYYTRQGYRPQYALINREKDYTVRIDQGHFRDGDSNWIKKEPEFSFNWHERKLGNLPWSYIFTASYGKWEDHAKTSWHQDYILYFKRKPIKLSDSLTWNIGTGLEHKRESYNGMTSTAMRFNTSLSKSVNQRLTVWSEYNYTQNEDDLFDYNKVNVGRELVGGISYRIDRLNKIAYKKSYDLQKDRTYSDTFIWYRNLHCWDMTLSYEIKKVEHERKIRWDLAVARW